MDTLVIHRRRTTTPVRAKFTFEVEVAVTGAYLPGCAERGPSYSCGGTPAEPDSVEDVEIAEIGETHYVRAPKLICDGQWVTTSLLDGVDRTSAAYQQVCANILKLFGADAQRALIAEVEE